MNYLSAVGNLLFVAAIITLSACQSPSQVDNQVDEIGELEEIVSLTKRYITDNAILVMGGDALLIEDAGITGKTSSGIPYAQLTGEDVVAFLAFGMIGMSASKTTIEPYSCSVDEDAGVRNLIRFGRCVKDLMDRGICVYGYKADGAYHVYPGECEMN